MLARLLFPWCVISFMLGPVAVGQLITAHRGASHDAPENTLAAFRLAWEQGADAIEGDFRLSGDGRIVCVHDADTKRVAGVNHVVASTPLAELRRLDAGRRKAERFAGERLPTFAEVLAAVRTCGADGVGLKGERRVIDRGFVERLAAGGVGEFHVWTVDALDDARYFRELGAMGITTNRPAFIRTVLAGDER